MNKICELHFCPNCQGGKTDTETKLLPSFRKSCFVLLDCFPTYDWGPAAERAPEDPEKNVCARQYFSLFLWHGQAVSGSDPRRNRYSYYIYAVGPVSTRLHHGIRCLSTAISVLCFCSCNCCIWIWTQRICAAKQIWGNFSNPAMITLIIFGGFTYFQPFIEVHRMKMELEYHASPSGTEIYNMTLPLLSSKAKLDV
jgi:hypothetical protein